MRARYGVSFVRVNSEICSDTIAVVFSAVSYYTGPRYNGTTLYWVTIIFVRNYKSTENIDLICVMCRAFCALEWRHKSDTASNLTGDLTICSKAWSDFCEGLRFRMNLSSAHAVAVIRPLTILFLWYDTAYQWIRANEMQICCKLIPPPGVVHMRRWTGPALVQIMTCHQCSAMPLPEPIVKCT